MEYYVKGEKVAYTDDFVNRVVEEYFDGPNGELSLYFCLGMTGLFGIMLIAIIIYVIKLGICKKKPKKN